MIGIRKAREKSHLRLNPAVWSFRVGEMFLPALDGANLKDFENDVESGLCALWECSGCFVLTEDRWPRLHVWLVGGKNFNDAAHAINNHLHAFNYFDCTWRTRNPAALRLYGFLQPELINHELHEYRVWPF
jgi:hypothetical protein